MKSYFGSKAEAFAPSLMRLQDEAPNPLGRKVLLAIVGLTVALLVWAFWGQLDIVAIAQGKLVPKTYVKIVQPTEAGIVREILVKEGDTVQAGQVLLRMDTDYVDADATALTTEIARKQLVLRRIDAELSGRQFNGGQDMPDALVAEVAAQDRANRAALDAALAEERSRLVKARQDLAAAEQVRAKLVQTLPHYLEQERAFEKLAQVGFAGALMSSDKKRERIEREQELRTQDHVIKSAQAGIEQSQRRLDQIVADHRRERYAERNEVANALDKLVQERAKQSHRREAMELRAPQAGIIKDLATHTTGTVVQPATVLLTLVPNDEALRAEVWVSNEDVGFVRPGQTVKLKFSAYPFQKYGMAEGVLEHIGADAADTGEGASAPSRQMDRPLVYKALVKLNQPVLHMNGMKFPLSAGMQTSAEVLLGKRTVAEYLLSPLQKAWHEAALER